MFGWLFISREGPMPPGFLHLPQGARMGDSRSTRWPLRSPDAGILAGQPLLAAGRSSDDPGCGIGRRRSTT